MLIQDYSCSKLYLESNARIIDEKLQLLVRKLCDISNCQGDGNILAVMLCLSNFNNYFMVFSFLAEKVHFISKNAISCLLLKNILPSKSVVCFILNNLHFPMGEGIALYALYKSRLVKHMTFVYL